MMVTTIALLTITTTTTAQTASDHYLDIANYATIDETGWSTEKIDHIYQYTETSATTAWVTMSVYGVVYGGGKKNWIEVSNGSSLSLSSHNLSWNATSPFLGSSAYFTSTTAKAFGYSTSQNTANRTVTFYVTNTTGLRLLGTNKFNEKQKATILNIYECTKNANGTLTPNSSVLFSKSETGKNASFNFNYLSLQENKYYKVECSTIGGYFFEIAFRMTPPQYIDVTISDALVSTFYYNLPVIIPYTDDGLYRVSYPHAIENNSLKMTTISNDIPAKTPVILEAHKPGTYRFYRNTGTVTPLANNNLLSGSLTDTNCSTVLEEARNAGVCSSSAYVMTIGHEVKTNEIGFHRYLGSALGAHKAFLIYDPGTTNNNVSFLSINKDDENTDGIRDVRALNSDDAWYTLQGARLSGKPSQRGIYIHCGKKVTLK